MFDKMKIFVILVKNERKMLHFQFKKGSNVYPIEYVNGIAISRVANYKIHGTLNACNLLLESKLRESASCD